MIVAANNRTVPTEAVSPARPFPTDSAIITTTRRSLTRSPQIRRTGHDPQQGADQQHFGSGEKYLMDRHL
jgi:hypothetical protein